MKARIPNQGGNSQANMMKKIQDMQNEMARVQQEVEESEFEANGKKTLILYCEGHCDRRKRPLSCRIFPLFKIDGELKNDLRAVHICPLAKGNLFLSAEDRDAEKPPF